jgi:hypothetical protein
LAGIEKEGKRESDEDRQVRGGRKERRGKPQPASGKQVVTENETIIHGRKQKQFNGRT